MRLEFPGGPRSTVSTRIASRLAALILLCVVLIHGRPLLMPLVLAMLLAFLVFPVVQALVIRRVPPGLGILVGQASATLPLAGLTLLFIASFGPFTRELPKYQARLTVQAGAAVDYLVENLNFLESRAALEQDLKQNLIPELMQNAMAWVQQGFKALSTVAGYLFLTVLLSTFILIEAQRFREKIVEGFGTNNALLKSLEFIGQDVRAYVAAKTLISGATGLCVWAFLAACGVDFALLWGLLAFPLNFIPTVGALVASVPPIAIAMVDPDISTLHLAGVIVGLVVINGVIGAFLDPRLVGRSVKLSPLVVFLSMLLWGLLWGPVGMILAVPIMVSVKVICKYVPGLEPVATLLKA